MIKIRNKYEVSVCQRKKWSPMAQNAFNESMNTGEMMYKSNLFHPDMVLPVDHFNTINRNLAWMMAEHIDRCLLDYENVDGS